jgi:rod shape-determining protein MreC
MSERQDHATSFLVILVILSFALMTLDIRSSGGGAVGTLRTGVQSVFAPVQKLATTIVDPVFDLVDGIANAAGLRDANAQLQQRIQELEAKVDELSSVEAELESLRNALGLVPADQNIATVAARVIARGDSFDASFQIDRGSSQGVLAGMPVVDDTGALVGTVIDVTSDSATVVPIISPSADGVRVKTPAQQIGVVLGRGANELDLELLDTTEPVAVGDLLKTSGSERYPGGIKVAKVAEDVRPEANRIVATATPLADFPRLDIVLVLQWTFTGTVEETTTTTSTTTTSLPDSTSTTGGDG